MNIDPVNTQPSPSMLYRGGQRYARIVLRPDAGVIDYVERCATAKLNVIACLARESFADFPSRREALAYYAEHASPYVWQIGNEPDQESPSSWTMTPAEYRRLFEECFTALSAMSPSAKFITAGMASGQPSYLEAVGKLPVIAYAVHPYGQRPTTAFPRPDWGFGNVGDLVSRYPAPVWFTEFGCNEDQYAAEYYRLMRPKAPVACWFCWSDKMVPGYGILNTEGVPKFRWW